MAVKSEAQIKKEAIKVWINKSGGRTWEIQKSNGEKRILH